MNAGLPVPGGDPAQLQSLADELEVLGMETGNLGGSTRQAGTSIVESSDWTGEGATSFSGFAENLGQGVSGAEGPFSNMASAVREYAGFLTTAQQKVQTYNSLAEAIQANGSPGGALLADAENAGQAAMSAVQDLNEAGTRAAATVTSESDSLQGLFGSGPAGTWISSQPVLGTDFLPPGVFGEPGDPIPPESGGSIIDWIPPDPVGGDIIDPVPPDIGGGSIIDPVPPDIGGGPEIYPLPPVMGPLINYDQEQDNEGTQSGIAQPGTTGTGRGFDSEGQPTPDDNVNNYIRPPVEGDTNYQVFDPYDKGTTITDIDKVSGGTLVEEKSFTGASTQAQNEAWVQRQIIPKLDRYVEARQYMPGYENAPLGVDLTDGANPQLQQAVTQAVDNWKQANPGVPVTVQWGNS
jgi:hypothetical protein